MFNNPYGMYPIMNPGMNFGNQVASGAIKASKGGFFKSLASIKWGNILNNTQKTLNVINQAIPVYYQIKPICNNLKSFGKIMSIFNESDNSNNNVNNNDQINKLNYNNKQNTNLNQNNNLNKKENSPGLPTFFIN